MSDVPTVNTGNAPVRTMCCGATHTHKNAHRAAGNLLISANYFSRATERFCVSASEIKDRGGRIFFFFFGSAESKTNKDCDNRAQETDNPGGAEFNPHLSLKQSDGSILKP